jgi:hypothetical protein
MINLLLVMSVLGLIFCDALQTYGYIEKTKLDLSAFSFFVIFFATLTQGVL